MLKNKLLKQSTNRNNSDSSKDKSTKTTQCEIVTSQYFNKPFWLNFYDIECNLNVLLRDLSKPNNITYIYNPIEYASELHIQYLQKFLHGPKKVMFIGMNPGPNGMLQTGIPFGNVNTVLTMMNIKGNVEQPDQLHPKRPVTGLNCSVEERSGLRFWNLIYKLSSESLETFSQQCFVHNFCPLAFFDKDGRNITPSELKGESKTQVRDVCLRSVDDMITLVNPAIIVAVGSYVYDTLKKSHHHHSKSVLKLKHPSPRSLNNNNWEDDCHKFLVEQNLLKFIRNEI